MVAVLGRVGRRPHRRKRDDPPQPVLPRGIGRSTRSRRPPGSAAPHRAGGVRVRTRPAAGPPAPRSRRRARWRSAPGRAPVPDDVDGGGQRRARVHDQQVAGVQVRRRSRARTWVVPDGRTTAIRTSSRARPRASGGVDARPAGAAGTGSPVAAHVHTPVPAQFGRAVAAGRQVRPQQCQQPGRDGLGRGRSEMSSPGKRPGASRCACRRGRRRTRAGPVLGASTRVAWSRAAFEDP